MTTRRHVLRSFLGLAAVSTLGNACSGAANHEHLRTPRTAGNPRPPATPALAAEPALDPILAMPRDPGFFGEDDTALRQALAEQPVASIAKGGGGRSLGFKITLADGTMGYFKPEQAIDYTHWWAELGAYYLDRELGFGRVAPAVGRRFDWGRLQLYAQTDPRLSEMRPRGNGTIRGAFIAWIHEGPAPLRLGRDWEKWVRIEGPIARTPYVPPRFQSLGYVPASRTTAPDVPEDGRRPAELSDMLLFDYLVQNADRWGSDNVNVRTRGVGGPLMLFDNGAGFWPTDQRLPIMERRLTEIQRFRRSTVDSMRRFDMARFRDRVGKDPLDPILTERMYQGVEERLGVIVAHVDTMLDRFGDRVFIEG